MEADRENAYWCFICERQFTAVGQAQACAFCSNTAFEAIDASHQTNEPSTFQVYQIPSPSPSPQAPNPSPSPQQQPFHYVPANNMFPPNFVQALQFAPGLTMQTLSLSIPQANANLFNTFNQIQQALFVPGGGISNLINSLFGQSNLTAASGEEVGRLERIEEVPECSICQEQNEKIEGAEERRGVKLRCGHMFHHHCIGPWFERTNTCPSCRLRI